MSRHKFIFLEVPWGSLFEKMPTSFSLVKLATTASLSASILLIALKVGAYVISDSLSILSTLVDSMLDGLASLVNFYAVRRALRPATSIYRFGHGKIEAIAALGQSMFVAGSSFFLLFSAVHRFYHPQPLESSGPALIIMIISSALTLILISFQKFVINKTHSLAVSADALHYLSDIFINFGVIGSLFIGHLFNIQLMDPFFALIVGFYILYSSFKMTRKALHVLMDRELSESERTEITKIVLNHPKVLGLHDLRTRSSGLHQFIQLHLELDDLIPLIEAHTIADEVENNVLKKFPTAEVLIHQDPKSVTDSMREKSSFC